MATPREYDVIVVGAGVMGSYTAYHLSKHGKRVLLLDQFLLPTTRGSSSGPSRIIRNAYIDEQYARMMPGAFRMWRTLERETDTKLITQTGMLSLGKEDSKLVTGVRKSLQKWNLPNELLTPHQVRDRYPMIKYPDDYVGVLDTEAGLINADKCLTSLWSSIRKSGATIRDGEEVSEIIPGSVVIVKTNKGMYRGRHVVLTPGPWANDMLRKLDVTLPLKTMRGYHVYWKEKVAGSYTPGAGFPIVLDDEFRVDGYTFYYAFPSVEYPGLLKIGMRKVPPAKYCHPDERDKDFDFGPFVAEVSGMVRRHYPGVHDNPCISEPCVYTMSPDGDFVIDKHPRHRNIIIGAGFSGHGFKLAPVVGQLLSELCLQKAPSFDLKRFKISRFSSHQSKL